MAPKKPENKTDLTPPFQRIGEHGWDARLRELLEAYGVPEARPVAESEIVARESELGFRLDDAFRSFLRTFGALDFGSMRVLSLGEVQPLSDVWFASHLSIEERARLTEMVAVVDYLGTGDFVAWGSERGGFWLVGHDPAGIHEWLPTFDDCVREQCLELAVGYYGWPDDEVRRLVDEARRELFPSL